MLAGPGPHDGLTDPGRLRRLAPFAVAASLGFVFAPLPPRPFGTGVAVALGLFLLIAAAIAALPWRRLPAAAQAVPAFGYLGVIVVLRDAEGGAGSGVSPLVMLPIFWLALYGTRKQLTVMLVAVAAVFIAPILIVGAPRYPAAEWERAALWAFTGAIVGFTVQALVRRVSAQAEALERLSRTDPLTGIGNRRAWKDELERELQRAKRSGRPLCVALLDFDRFKAFNDLNGHPAGDALLREAARAWRSQLRPTDTIVRYGGEEFGVVLPDCDVRAALEAIERLRRVTPEVQTASAGIAAWDASESPERLVARADAALYEAKQQGRDRAVVSTSTA